MGAVPFGVWNVGLAGIDNEPAEPTDIALGGLGGGGPMMVDMPLGMSGVLGVNGGIGLGAANLGGAVLGPGRPRPGPVPGGFVLM